MKNNYQIPRKSTKIKRGTEFIIRETGERVKFEIIDPDGNYLVLRADGVNYDPYPPGELKEAVAGRGTISQVVKPVSPEEKKFRADLNVFFASQTLTMPNDCENCGKPLDAHGLKERRCTIAHILAKGKNNGNFREVATHPQNRMFLGAKCGCHNKWDQGDSKSRKKMNCYPIALERFEKFKELIPSNKLPKAYTYLGIEWQ